MAHIYFGCNKNCFNGYETFRNCINCGCCSKDKATRYRARYELAKRLISKQLHYSDWLENKKLMELQERNILINIHYFEQMMKRYERLMKNVKD